MVRCPLHRNSAGQPETNPSCGIHIHNGLWHCFSCGQRGNFKQLLFKMGVIGEGPLPIEWEEVIQQLKDAAPAAAPRNGYWLKPFPPELVLPESTLGLFQFVPDQMLKWGFQRKTLIAHDVGLDKRNIRITFPLRDFTGQLVGFSGRALLDQDLSRYKVYTELEYKKWGVTALPPAPKGQILWGYHQAVAVLQQRPGLPIFLTEGFKAHLWLTQCGCEVVIASLGSDMTAEHMHLIERLGGPIYLFWDNDKAGEKKYEVASRLSQVCDVRIPTYPTVQPDQLSPAQVAQATREAASYVEWRLKQPAKNPYTYRREKTR